MLIIAKAFAAILGILVIARSIIDYKKKSESLTMTVFWIVVWLGIMMLAFWPDLIDKFIRLTGGQRTGLGTVFGMAIAFVLFVNYRVYIKANRIEKILGKVVRDVALEELNDKKAKK